MFSIATELSDDKWYICDNRLSLAANSKNLAKILVRPLMPPNFEKRDGQCILLESLIDRIVRIDGVLDEITYGRSSLRLRMVLRKAGIFSVFDLMIAKRKTVKIVENSSSVRLSLLYIVWM